MKHPLFRASLLLLVLALASGCPGPATPGGLSAPKPTRSTKPKATTTPGTPLPVINGSPTPSPTATPTATASPSAQPSGTASPSASPSPSAPPSASPSPSGTASPTSNAVTTFVGGEAGLAEGSGTTARFNSPNGLDVDAAGNLYVADAGNHRVRKITPAGVVSTFAGTDAGFENGAAASAKFNGPYGVAVGPSGEVYVADTGNHAIRRISTDGQVTTVAGGVEGFVNAQGTAARLRSPFSVASDGFGTLLVADFNNHAIRRVDRSTSEVPTMLGNGTAGAADGAKAVAQLNYPTGVAMDATGRILVADNQNHRIRMVSLSGELSTLAGGEKGLENGVGRASASAA